MITMVRDRGVAVAKTATTMIQAAATTSPWTLYNIIISSLLDKKSTRIRFSHTYAAKKMSILVKRVDVIQRSRNASQSQGGTAAIPKESPAASAQLQQKPNPRKRHSKSSEQEMESSSRGPAKRPRRSSRHMNPSAVSSSTPQLSVTSPNAVSTPSILGKTKTAELQPVPGAVPDCEDGLNTSPAAASASHPTTQVELESVNPTAGEGKIGRQKRTNRNKRSRKERIRIRSSGFLKCDYSKDYDFYFEAEIKRLSPSSEKQEQVSLRQDIRRAELQLKKLREARFLPAVSSSTPPTLSTTKTAEEPLLDQDEGQTTPSGPADSHRARSEPVQKNLFASLKQQLEETRVQLQLVETICHDKDKVIKDLQEGQSTLAQLQFETWKQKQHEDAKRRRDTLIQKLEDDYYLSQDQLRMDEITEWKAKFDQKDSEAKGLKQHHAQEMQLLQNKYLGKKMEAKRLLGKLLASNQVNQQHAKVNQAREEDILQMNKSIKQPTQNMEAQEEQPPTGHNMPCCSIM
jgi:hypothetical protein